MCCQRAEIVINTSGRTVGSSVGRRTSVKLLIVQVGDFYSLTLCDHQSPNE